MNYNDQVKFEVPIVITTVPEDKIHQYNNDKTIKLSEIITIKK